MATTARPSAPGVGRTWKRLATVASSAPESRPESCAATPTPAARRPARSTGTRRARRYGVGMALPAGGDEVGVAGAHDHVAVVRPVADGHGTLGDGDARARTGVLRQAARAAHGRRR